MQEPTSDLKTRKKKVRTTALSRRLSMSGAVAASHSEAIRSRLEAIDLLSEVACVHAFWPIHEKHEVDLRPLLRTWVNDGRTVVLPVVRSGASGRTPILEHRRYTNDECLVTSDWGIAEPIDGDEVHVRDIDVVLVPALTVDEAGYRVGYGMGFYDRFLSEVDAVRICPVYDDYVVRRLPREPHDQPVDVIVTELRTLTLRRT